MKIVIMKLIISYSSIYGIDPNISLAVAELESGFNPNIVSYTHDIGVFQLNPKSFPNYTIKQLKTPEINIRLGVKYLVEVRDHCFHKNDLDWLVCYNYGYQNAKHVRYPKLFPYVVKMHRIMDKTLLVAKE